MTYLQLMKKVLEVFIKEAPSNDYNEYWRRINETREEFVKGLKLDLMYLLLTRINNKNQVNHNLLNIIERQLTSYDISFSKTLEVSKRTTEEEILEDPNLFDAICLIQNEDIDEELKQELANDIANQYIDKLGQNFKNNIQKILIAKPMDNIIYDVITLLPELFFTEKGYSYIPEEYRIDDEELRQQCYHYVIDSIISYRNSRIDDYGREKFGIPKDEPSEYDNDDYEDDETEDYFDEYEDEEYDDDYEDEEYDDNEEDADEYGVEEWVIDTQFTGYSGLYYSIKLISIVLTLIKNRQYDKLNKLICIDEYIKSESERIQGERDYYTLIEILYDTRSISEFDLDDEVFARCESDDYLNFFLDDSVLSSKLTNDEIGRLILYYFDAKDQNSIKEINNNLDRLEMRRKLRPKEKFFDTFEFEYSDIKCFQKDDNNIYPWINSNVMGEDRSIDIVVFDDNDESYVPDSIIFDYIICDCKENLRLTSLDEWKKLYEENLPIIFINTSYMFRQFETINVLESNTSCENGPYLWAKYFYENYKKIFWLKDKAKFIFIVSSQNLNKMLEYQCKESTIGIDYHYLEKNKNSIEQKNSRLVKKRIPPKQTNDK